MSSEFLKVDENKSFIKQNAYWIYKYINEQVLKDIGVLSSSYFIKIIEDVLVVNKSLDKHNLKTLPYSILTQINGSGTMTYTSIRHETIDLSQLNKEASTYYNYIRFSLKDNSLDLELMQSKIGGMPIDGDIVKFTKEIPIDDLSFSEYIQLNKKELGNHILSESSYIEISNAINKMFP